MLKSNIKTKSNKNKNKKMWTALTLRDRVKLSSLKNRSKRQ